MRFILKLLLITIGGTFISSLYLISDQKSENFTAIHHGTSLSKWYLMDSFIDSSFGFGTTVIWPYIISEWISPKFGLFLLFYCFGIDESFRIFWFVYHQWFHYNLTSKNIYLCTWATINDFNTYFIVPLFVLIYHYYYNKKNEAEQTVELITENNQNEHISTLKSSNNIEKIKKIASSHFNKIIFGYIGTGIWFTIQDGYQYYYQNERWSPIFRLPPFVITSLLFLYERYICGQHKNKHKNDQFVHFILLCLFIMCQELLFDWTILVYKIKNWTKHWNQHIAKLTVFVVYTIYFKILSFISGLLTQHICYKQRVVYQLHFIFMVFFDVYLTLYLSASTTIDWTIIVMILTKLFAKFFKFNKKMRSYIPYLSDYVNANNKKIAIHYVYSILSSCIVYIGQITLLLIDYYIYTGNTGWILSPISANKTINNLLRSILLLFISFITECIAFCLVFITSQQQQVQQQQVQQQIVSETSIDNNQQLKIEIDRKESKNSNYSIASSEFNIYDATSHVALPLFYFCCVVANAQISSLNTTQFFPWYL